MAKKKLIDSNGFLYVWGQIKEKFAPKDHSHNYAGSDSAGGAANTAKKLSTAVHIDGMSFDGSADIAHYAVCDSANDTVEKTVTLTGFALKTGSRIAIKFTHGTRGNSPTLNINGMGAKSMKYGGAVMKGVALAAGRVYEFLYDGVSYELVGELDTDTVGMEEEEFVFGADETGTTQRPVSMAAYLIDPEDFDETTPFDTLANVGGTGRPVYFKDGVPVAIDHTIAKSVPSDAKFTDTTYEEATTSKSGLMSKEDKGKLEGIPSDTQTQLNNRYTKNETNSAISAAVAAAGHIKRSIVTALPAVSVAEANVIYMVKDEDAEERDIYLDYMLIDGALVQVGDSSANFEVMTNEEIDAILAQ